MCTRYKIYASPSFLNYRTKIKAKLNGFIIFFLKYFFNRVIITLFAIGKEIYKTSITMSGLIKNLGVIVLLIGVVILAVPFLTGSMTNGILFTGLLVIILGYVGHIVINKRVE